MKPVNSHLDLQESKKKQMFTKLKLSQMIIWIVIVITVALQEVRKNMKNKIVNSMEILIKLFILWDVVFWEKSILNKFIF